MFLKLIIIEYLFLTRTPPPPSKMHAQKALPKENSKISISFQANWDITVINRNLAFSSFILNVNRFSETSNVSVVMKIDYLLDNDFNFGVEINAHDYLKLLKGCLGEHLCNDCAFT